MLKGIVTILLLLIFIYLAVPWFLSWTTSDEYKEDIDIHHLSVDPGHKKYYEVIIDGKEINFNLLDPGMAPDNIRDKVQLGFKIMNHTDEHAKEYIGGKMSCTNCHFCGGNTFGGKNGSISLVGAPFWYPEYSQRDKKNITLEDRINNCFARSENGKPLPKDSHIMEAIFAYLEWISSEVKDLKEYPWRGLKPLKSKHVANYENGKKVYEEKCALCHMADGDGSCEYNCTVVFPPLWGNSAFNDGAGMSRPEKFATFVYSNMPFQQPSLNEEESIDVAEYVLKQHRPHFIPW